MISESLIFLVVIGVFGGSSGTSVTHIHFGGSESQDDPKENALYEQLIEKGTGGLQSQIDQVQSVFNTLKQSSVTNSNKLHKSYIQNFESVKNQLEASRQKMISSYTDSYNSVKTSLSNNYNQVENKIKSNFESSLTNFKLQFGKLAKTPTVRAFLDNLIARFESEAAATFSKTDNEYKSLIAELDNEFNNGIAALKL